MYISRIVVRGFRNFAHLDIKVEPGVTCIVGENNTGKTNFLHAVRLVIDAGMSSYMRQLTDHDVHSALSLASPCQVIVSIEFRDYTSRENEMALVGAWEVGDDIARLSYRFRPRSGVREEIVSKEREGKDLTLNDYHWEMTGGGANDPVEVKWDEDLGKSIRMGDLQAFQVVLLQALRDVQSDLRNSRLSPLGRLLSSADISQEEKDELVKILREANEEISQRPSISGAGADIKGAFQETAGDAFAMDVRVGMSDPSFTAISRALTVLLSDDALELFEPGRNGLGLNNILYISTLLKFFERRVAAASTAGQLLLIEEPEAHLHPQLQRTLLGSLKGKPFQTFLTTHSTHISSLAPLSSVVSLTKRGGPGIQSAALVEESDMDGAEVADLERYLDATRSSLLFARRVMLVEGPAELFLIPALVKKVMKVDLDRAGISVIPIYGTHFEVYSKLFGEKSMPKKCAIVADGDLSPSDAQRHDVDEELPSGGDLGELESNFVKVFRCPVTFEIALAIPGLLPMLKKACEECGSKKGTKLLGEVIARLGKGGLKAADVKAMLREAGDRVLKLAKQLGKARFAQIASKHVEAAKAMPEYLEKAVKWLTAK